MLDPWVYTVFTGDDTLYMVVAHDGADVIEGLRRAGKPATPPLTIAPVEQEDDLIDIRMGREPERGEVPAEATILQGEPPGGWAVRASAIDWAEHFEPHAPCLLRVTQAPAEVEPDGEARVYKVRDGLGDTTYVVARHPAHVLRGIEDWGEASGYEGDHMPVTIEAVEPDSVIDVLYDWPIADGDPDVPDGATIEAPDPNDEFGGYRVRATATQWTGHYDQGAEGSASICSTRWA